MTGTSFSAGPTLAEITYDSLEDGVCNTTADIGTWQSVMSLTINTDNQRNSYSTYNAYLNFIGTDGNNSGYFKCVTTTLSTKWFCQYWFKISENWDWGTTDYGGTDKFLSNVKIFRLWNPGASVDESFYMNTWGWSKPELVEYAVEMAGDGTHNCESNYKTNWTKGVWHLFQFQFSEASAVSTDDGTFKMWRDGQLVANSVHITRKDYDVNKRPFELGFYNSWMPHEGTNPDTYGAQTPNDFYIDDVYASTSWCRVEIGNNSVYTSCTHREIQIPTSWSDTSIAVTFNQGSFNAGDQVYLFVIDSDGTASDGYPITIGGTSINTTGSLQMTGSLTIE